MRHPLGICLPVAWLLCMVTGAPARAAEPDEKTQCIGASDEGQQLRDDGYYKRARESFARCSRMTCPAIVRQECAQWLVDLEARAPTVVFDAKDDKGNDLVNVKVTVDDTVLTDKLDGLPTAIDGGAHVLRFESDGFAPVEERVVLVAGEKNRVVQVRFVASPATSPPPPPEPNAMAEAAPLSRVPSAAWIFAGLAVASFASETYFGLSGLGQYNRDTGTGPNSCAGHCPASEKSSIQTQFAIADVSLGVGVVSAGLAVYFFLRPRPSATPPATAIDVSGRPGGGVATLTGRF